MLYLLFRIIHNTNLGGSISLEDFILIMKRCRATMATAYLLLATIQLSIIFLTQPLFKLDPAFSIGVRDLCFVEIRAKNITLKLFDNLFAYIILAFGLSLIIKSIL